MVKSAIVIIIAMFCFNSCIENTSLASRRRKINELLRTGNVCDKIEANLMIKETNDSLYLPVLLSKMNDYSTCATRSRVKGFSVYESKIAALEKIANLDTVLIYTHYPDSSIIKFFIKKFKSKF